MTQSGTHGDAPRREVMLKTSGARPGGCFDTSREYCLSLTNYVNQRWHPGWMTHVGIECGWKGPPDLTAITFILRAAETPKDEAASYSEPSV